MQMNLHDFHVLVGIVSICMRKGNCHITDTKVSCQQIPLVRISTVSKNQQDAKDTEEKEIRREKLTFM